MPCASLLRGLPALAGAAVFAAGLAAAQDADLDARIEEAQQRYEEAWTTGDIDALVELHAEDAVMWPFDGGMHEGRDAIRGYFEDNPRPESFDVRSGRTERIGEFILNVGTFTGAMPADAGGADARRICRHCPRVGRRAPAPPRHRLPAAPRAGRGAIARAPAPAPPPRA